MVAGGEETHDRGARRRTQAREEARLGRITLITWARSHRNLANGIAVPASIDVMSMVRSAAEQAWSPVPGVP